MESVILAAGRGQRMEGIAKPFFKPLLEINGIPLITYAAEYASSAGATRVTVVASDANADDIKKALKMYASWVDVVIQSEPRGPGNATLIGLNNTDCASVMLLMSDNIMNTATVSQMATAAMINDTDAVGTAQVRLARADRFTRVRISADGHHSYVEGIPLSIEDESSKDTATVWCGPLIFNRGTAVTVLTSAQDAANGEAGEFKIGPYLNKIMRPGALLMDVNAMDVGIPAAYTEQLKRKND
jgi:bifunctional N-acetylglucosamine-1-phosphate-uridyltransferase/glucosamine-1-phosphate-acetyltransferase GlmU-like protein